MTSVPLFVTCGDISPRRGENLSRPGEVCLPEGGFGSAESFSSSPEAPSQRELAPKVTEGVTQNIPASVPFSSIPAFQGSAVRSASAGLCVLQRRQTDFAAKEKEVAAVVFGFLKG